MAVARRWVPLAAIIWLAAPAGVWAVPDVPGPATVCVARADHILVPEGISAPRVLFPEGRVDFDVVEKLVDGCMESLTGKKGAEAWRQYFSATDKIGIIVDVGKYPIQTATVETIIDRLVDTGVSPDNICVFAGDERDLFVAGFTIRRDGHGVKTYGAESEGFRHGMSRIVLDYCDALINLADLRADNDIGLAGCVASLSACVPSVERLRLRATPELLGSVGAHPAIRQKLRLNFLEAYMPILDVTAQGKQTWQYRGLLVSPDPVAIDVMGAQIVQARRDQVRGQPWPLTPAPTYLRAAQERYRLGQADKSKITVRLRGPTEEAYVAGTAQP